MRFPTFFDCFERFLSRFSIFTPSAHGVVPRCACAPSCTPPSSAQTSDPLSSNHAPSPDAYHQRFWPSRILAQSACAFAARWHSPHFAQSPPAPPNGDPTCFVPRAIGGLACSGWLGVIRINFLLNFWWISLLIYFINCC